MNFSEFLERLNYIMELINLMSFYDAPDIFNFDGEDEEESSVTNNCFFQNESYEVYNKWDSNLSLGDFVNRSEKNVSLSKMNRDLLVTDTQNLWENYKSLLQGDNAYNNALKAIEGINNFSFGAVGENSLLESFCKKERERANEIYFGESIERAEMLANTAAYNNVLRIAEGERKTAERDVYKADAISAFVYDSRERADSMVNAFSEAESFAELVYHKMDSEIGKGESITGEYNTRINQMYHLWDSVAENETSVIESIVELESIVEKGAVHSKWYNNIGELTKRERESLQLSSSNSSTDIKAFLRESLQRDNRSEKGSVNVNVDFKAYAEVKNDYDTEKFAQVFARYLESQLESCAEGLHY